MDRQRKNRAKKKIVRPRRNSRLSHLSRQEKILLIVAAVLAVMLVGVLVYKSLFVRPDVTNKKPVIKDEQTQEEIYIDYGDGVRPKADGERKSKDFYTVLILGRDTGGGGNTDTMLLASYDVTNQKATVMSIPRDTMVNVGWDVKKINSVYNWNGGGEKGIAAVYKEVAQLVGFEPDYRVVVEWDAVGKIVDAMGGVYFDVPYNMDYHDPYQDLVIEQEAGYRLLNGDDAMQVIRWRKNDPWSPYGEIQIGDSGRMEMQQQFLKAVIKQMMQPKVVLKLGEISKVFQESVETDMSFQNILWFGKSAFEGGLALESVEFCTMPYSSAMVWSRTYNQNLSYLLPKANALLELVNGKLSPFVETSVLSDLDIMYVNSDGSVGSTSGHVEDAKAAQPPVKPEKEEETPGYTFDEYGNVVDPETGAVIYYVDANGNMVDANTGEMLGGGTDVPENETPVEGGEQPAEEGSEPTEEEAPEQSEAPAETSEPAEPVVPNEPAEPEADPAE